MAKKYLSRLEDGGFRFEKLYLSGATESMLQKQLVDLVIDIVYSGKSAEEAGLKVYDKIFESDMVVIGCKEVKNDRKELSWFASALWKDKN